MRKDFDVIVVGGGHAGLSIAARLGQLQIDALVVDRLPRVGDNWRKRYHSLALHNSTEVNHLPYMPFPPSWPRYLPKDMLADWFEAYAWAMELKNAGTVDVPLAWQQPDVYHDYWVVTGTGGYVFGQNDDGSYNPDDVGIDSEGALAAAEIFGQLAADGAISQDVTYDVMIDSFSSGKAPYAITGPWALASFADVNYVVENGEDLPFGFGVERGHVDLFGRLIRGVFNRNLDCTWLNDAPVRHVIGFTN